MSKTAVAHRSALGKHLAHIRRTGWFCEQRRTWNNHTEGTLLTHQSGYSDRHLSLLPVWVTSPRFSIFRTCLLLSRDKNPTQPLGGARFHGGGRQSSTGTNSHPTTHHSWFLQQLEDACQTKGQQTELRCPQQSLFWSYCDSRQHFRPRWRPSSSEKAHIPAPPSIQSWGCCLHRDVQSSALCLTAFDHLSGAPRAGSKWRWNFFRESRTQWDHQLLQELCSCYCTWLRRKLETGYVHQSNLLQLI